MELAELLPVLLGTAWLLPLASFLLIVFVGPRLGKSGVLAGTVATGAILTSFVLSAIALISWLSTNGIEAPAHHGVHGTEHASTDHAAADDHAADAAHADAEHSDAEHAAHGPIEPITGVWYSLGIFGALKIQIGYYIDALTVAMFAMVTLIATCIHFYAIGYMHDELHEVIDHEVTLSNGHHLHRKGRFYRFFQYLSLFCFSMLGLVIAGNIAMVFVFWELVGICSYFLIGFYIERKSASNAANKAFIVNRVGDFGMIIGLMALFGALGTFNFGDVKHEDGTAEPGIFSQVRPAGLDHAIVVPDGMLRAAAFDELAERGGTPPTAEDYAKWRGDADPATPEHELSPVYRRAYWLLVIAGLGIFCGCVGKSAQFPLHVWLPDAMEGPTPVSALVHSATMVAAGVYLVGRFFPVFAPEALLVIAYIGAITLFIAATIAITATDIKRVLAYSTVSQLGYMMLALGVGGWLAGMMHLFTHAFFKSLLFMCSGSVIHACHTNEMPRMGGLRHKMPWTAYTMLVGCLAIAGAGVPFVIGFSGYYSKDKIIEQAMMFANDNPSHSILLYAAAGGAAITAFYMFRLWYMTFAGKPREQEIFDLAHESPKVMYLPLVLLSVFAVGVGWPHGVMLYASLAGLVVVGGVVTWKLMTEPKGAAAHLGEHPVNQPTRPEYDGSHGEHGDVLAVGAEHEHEEHDTAAGGPWDAAGIILGILAVAVVAALWLPSFSLENLLEQARPLGPPADGVLTAGLHYAPEFESHSLVVPGTLTAFATALAGFLIATAFYGLRAASADEARRKFEPIYQFLLHKWYFDELYEVIFVQPVMFISRLVADFDKKVIDRLIDNLAWGVVWIAKLDDFIDRMFVDGLVNIVARWTYAAGLGLRRLQTGQLRTYVLAIVVGTVGLFALISARWPWF